MNNNYKQRSPHYGLLKNGIAVLTFVLLMMPVMLKAQTYCVPQPSPVGANAATEPISLVQFGTGANAINNPSPAEISTEVPKYEDFSSISMDVEKGSTYTLRVKGNTDGNNTNYITIYIDWNQNGVFSNSLSQNEKYQYTTALVNSTGLDDAEMVYDITIPAEALTGSTRMRIVKNYQAPSPDPCNAAITFGQIEDYTLNVIGATAVTGLTVSTQNNAPAAITTANGTLQLTAAVTPANANQSVTWTITQGSGFATISSTGLVTATANGSITVTATSVANNAVTGTLQIAVSNQTAAASCSFAAVAVTGFNADVIAEGTGGNANNKATQPIDGANGYYAQDFVPANPHSSGASAAAYGAGFPNNGTVNSAATSGLTFQLADFTANNALVLRNSLNNTGTLTFTEQKKAQKVYVAWVSAEGTNNVDVTVNFADGTSQVFAAQQANDWWSDSAPSATVKAAGPLGRVSVITTASWAPVNSFSGLTQTYLFQKEFELNASNYDKLIASVSFNKATSTNAATTTAVLGISICETPATPVIYGPVTITGGFNHDIIANGVGNASTSSTIGFDETNSRALVSLDFQATASSSVPAYGLPVNGTINSVNTTGVTFQLADYSGNNALFLTPGYVNNGAANNGTLNFTAQNAGTLYILAGAAGGGVQLLPFTAVVNFADGTSQTSTLNINDWYNGTGYAIQGTGRVNRANNNLEGDSTNPRLYEVALAIEAANQTKAISGITFTFNGNQSAEYANEIRMSVLAISTAAPQAPQEPEEDYCEVYFVNGCSDYMHIASVSTTGGATNISNLNTGCSTNEALPGYNNYTSQSVSAAQGGSVSFTMNFATTDLGTAYLSAWIDWNQDFEFSDDEQVYVSSDAEPNTLTFNVNVPANAALGSTRIRLKAVNGWVGSGACGYNSFGEIEDYTFTVITPVAVSSVTVATQDNVAAEITAENGTLQLVATVAPENATNANVVWSITEGSEYASVNQNGVVTAIANGTVTVRATSVADATKFDDIDVTINIEASNTCPSLTELYENFDTLSCCEMGVVPNCWNSILLNNASQIISSTQPASGTSQIYQTGYGDGKVSIVVLPHFSNVNAGTHQFRFKVKANSGPGALDFGYLNNANDESTFVLIQALTISNSSYTSADAERTIVVPTTVPAGARLAVRNPGTTWAGIYWDDVYWEPIPVQTVEVTTQNDVAATITTDNGTLQLEATVAPQAATVNWTITEGAENATVNAQGVVTAVANGSVTVRATIAGTEIYDEITVTISGQTIAATGVTISVEDDAPAAITTNEGTLQLIATVAPEDATNTDVTWAITSGSEFATIDENGVVTAVANGTVTVTVTTADGSYTDTIEITISGQTVAATGVTISVEDDAPAAITTNEATLQLIATVAPEDATNTDVTWAITSGAEFATIDENGVVTAVANGTVTVTVTTADGSYTDTIEITISGQTVAVTAITVTVENDAAPVISTLGETLQLIATVTPEDATNTDVTWTITSGAEFATVDENGVVTAVANGTVTVRATSDADTNIFDEIEITIDQAAGVNTPGKTAFSVYPNPADGIVNISSELPAKQINVYNQIGQRVITATNTSVINVSGIAAGVYIIEMHFDNGATATQKLIKK